MLGVRVEKTAEWEDRPWFLVRASLKEMTLGNGKTGNKCVLGARGHGASSFVIS